MLHISPDDDLIQPHGRRAKARRPQHCSLVGPFQFGILDLAVADSDSLSFCLQYRKPRIAGECPAPHGCGLAAHSSAVAQHRDEGLTLREMLLDKELEASLQHASAILGTPHHIILILVRFMALRGTRVHSCHHEPLTWQGVPRYQRKRLRHVNFRSSFDRCVIILLPCARSD